MGIVPREKYRFHLFPPGLTVRTVRLRSVSRGCDTDSHWVFSRGGNWARARFAWPQEGSADQFCATRIRRAAKLRRPAHSPTHRKYLTFEDAAKRNRAPHV